MNAPLLQVEHLTMRFGGLVAVDDVSFAAAHRQITAIIGPNGAGKTTVFNCIAGFYKPSVGRLMLPPEKRAYLLEGMQGHHIANHARVARTFQNMRLFGKMTVLENLIVAQPPEIVFVDKRRVSCNGDGVALGHPLVWYSLDDGEAECGYCDRKFIFDPAKAKR